MTETDIARLFAQAFAELDALRQRSPAAAAALSESIAAHLRSSTPLSLLVTPAAVPEIARDLKDGSRYRISRAESYTMLELSRLDAALTPIEAIRLREDIASVAGSVA